MLTLTLPSFSLSYPSFLPSFLPPSLLLTELSSCFTVGSTKGSLLQAPHSLPHHCWKPCPHPHHHLTHRLPTRKQGLTLTYYTHFTHTHTHITLSRPHTISLRELDSLLQQDVSLLTHTHTSHTPPLHILMGEACSGGDSSCAPRGDQWLLDDEGITGLPHRPLP